MFVCRYLNPLNETVIYGEGEDIQESWENLLDILESDYGLNEMDIHMNMIQFFEPAEVFRETKTVWTLDKMV